MNLLLLDNDDLIRSAGGGEGRPLRAEVAGERLRHVRKVLRAGVGDELAVGRLGGGIGRGRIVELSPRRAVLELDALDGEPPAPLPVTLVLALPRPLFVGRILQAAAAMGVKRIVFADTARVEKSYWQSSVLESAGLRRHLFLGLVQARDTVLPEICLLRRRRSLMEHLPGLAAQHSELLVADSSGDRPCPVGLEGSAALLVGPEGGFLEEELASFERAGARTVSLGPRVLRVEHAVVALLSRLGAG